MLLHGGRFEAYLYRQHVTHIICSNLPDTKLKQMARERCVWCAAAGHRVVGVCSAWGQVQPWPEGGQVLAREPSAPGPCCCNDGRAHAQHPLAPAPTHRDPLPVVRPEWIVASLQAGRVLPVSAAAVPPPPPKPPMIRPCVHGTTVRARHTEA